MAHSSKDNNIKLYDIFEGEVTIFLNYRSQCTCREGQVLTHFTSLEDGQIFKTYVPH